MSILRWGRSAAALLLLAACASAPAADGGAAAGPGERPGTAGTTGTDAPAPDGAVGENEPGMAGASDGASSGGEASGSSVGATVGQGAASSGRAPDAPGVGLEEGVTARSYAGFAPQSFDTEPVALLSAAAIVLPPDLQSGAQGEDLLAELQRLVLDRLPEEIRMLHTRAPVVGFRDWGAGLEAGPEGGYLRSIMGWDGQPGPEGQIPELVGNSVEALGDRRGVRYFLFPRSLSILRRDRFDYSAVLEAFLLDARGERVVWAATARADGALPEDDPTQILGGVIRDAAASALAELASELPGGEDAGGEGNSRGSDNNP
jgi:hypothetical protein